ncbi:MAG: bifunctional ornithine acetyltransferase/N-acetylglutamate synthase [Spirochaetota bacterium]|nr:bifunctional ornithine acetyltransferase/N-acetylglutamate synthase [Spirochaetota bacterium]
MVQIKQIEDGVTAPKGFRATGVSCGLKTGGSKDMSLLLSDKLCNVAMAFTKNRIQGAHIFIDKKRINKACHAILINSGNANCLTGQEGIDNAQQMINLTEELLNIEKGSCLLASTGTIGVPLNMTRVKYGIERLINVIPNETNVRHFGSGISTSDTRQKNLAYQFKIDQDDIVIGVSAKGESMIKPWLETMHGTLLAFITTDANISQALLQKALSLSIAKSFNRISIDNDISPNDSVFLLANGQAQNTLISEESDPRFTIFVDVLNKILIDIAKLLLKQGLGTTKLIHLQVKNAATMEQAESLIRSIAESYQVKTGFFGQKSAWQKIINVIASSNIDFEIEKMTLLLNNFILFEKGQPYSSHIAIVSQIMSAIECAITIDLGIGSHNTELWTCDLTHDYIKFNALTSES